MPKSFHIPSAFGKQLNKNLKRNLAKTIPASKVGNSKGGHGNFCGQSAVEKKKGSKKGGEGLARV